MKEFMVNYYASGEYSHAYNERWEVSEDFKFCPNCGSRGTVWMDQGGGDYYQGDSYLCAKCGAGFSTQGMSYTNDMADEKDFIDGQDVQRLRHLRK